MAPPRSRALEYYHGVQEQQAHKHHIRSNDGSRPSYAHSAATIVTVFALVLWSSAVVSCCGLLLWSLAVVSRCGLPLGSPAGVARGAAPNARGQPPGQN
jgi:hypothetical protein